MKAINNSTDVQTIINRMLDNDSANCIWDELCGCDMSKDTPETIEEEFHEGLSYMYDVLTSYEYKGQTLLQIAIDKKAQKVAPGLFELECIAHLIIKY